MRKSLMSSKRYRHVRGVTLMEVLITMVIMLFGLIGLSQMFVKAQRTASEAYDRHRALSQANYLAEMMRSMLRLKETSGAASVGANVCPTAAQMPVDGVLSNEQIMACFVELSKPNGAGQPTLGRFFDETTTVTPAVTKATLATAAKCGSATGTCNGRDMVLYMLNTWTESLSNTNQTFSAAPTNAVFSNRAFAAHGCVDKICNVEGDVAGCTGDVLNSVYRVRVYWRADEPISPDANRYYCGNTPNNFWRYTFVDVSLSAPSSR